jgi:murein L,D-transpeptidase YafK
MPKISTKTIEPKIEEPIALEQESVSSSDEEIILEKPIKEKKPRTEKQIESWNKALQVKRDNAEKRRLLKEQVKAVEKKELIVKKTRQQKIKERDEKQLQKIKELEAKAIPLVESDEEEEVIIKKRKPKKKIIKYVDSDGESEEEVEHKPIVIVNKFSNVPQPVAHKKVLIENKKNIVFV